MLLVDETTSTSQECPSGSDKGQETTSDTSMTGHSISIKHINKEDESAGTKKTNDESGQEKEIDVEKQEEMDVEEQEKMTVEQEGESTDKDEPEDEPSVIEFKGPVCKLSQMYEMESEYEGVTVGWEATEVWALSPAERAKYRELTRLQWWWAEVEKGMTGVSRMIEERARARTPGLLIDLIKRSVLVEPVGRQGLHQVVERQGVQTQIKQDEIPRTDRPRTGRGCCLFIGDGAGCMVGQQSGTQMLNNTCPPI